MFVQASNLTVGASALATSNSLQLTASLINSVGSDKLCCLGQAFAAIVDAGIADGSIGVRVWSLLQNCCDCCGDAACSDAACFCFLHGLACAWCLHKEEERCNGCVLPCCLGEPIHGRQSNAEQSCCPFLQALDAANALIANLFSLPYTATVKQLLQCFLFAL